MIPVIQTAGSKAGTIADAKEQFIASLFTSTVKGGWYDPSDMRTMFQDSYGTTPVTGLNQKVGLMLDKSQGLIPGTEQIQNFNFDNGSTSWLGGSPSNPQPISTFGIIENGSFKIDFTVASSPTSQFWILNQKGLFSLDEMEWYKLEFKVAEFVEGTIQFQLFSNTNNEQSLVYRNILASNNVYTEYFCTRPTYPAGGKYTTLQMVAYTGDTGRCKLTLEYISLKKIPGNHLISSEPGSVSDFRPTLKGTPNYLDFNHSIMTSVGFTMQTTTPTTRKYATISVGVDASGSIQGVTPGVVGFDKVSFGRIPFDENATGAFYQLILRYGANKNLGYSSVGTFPVGTNDDVGIGVNSGYIDLLSLGSYKLVWQSVINLTLSTVSALKNKLNSNSLDNSTQLVNASYLNTYFNPIYSLLVGWNAAGSDTFFYGKIYSLIVLGEVSDNTRLTQILDYINSKMPP